MFAKKNTSNIYYRTVKNRVKDQLDSLRNIKYSTTVINIITTSGYYQIGMVKESISVYSLSNEHY
ncbi:hypothetical protein V1477_003326 [Vespula maculifrons]|uniref:Uncharacterized protein n=1 Tax=Vespula maculifrons TaxID=7453 RepID=A0ABD2CWX8_VESMC